MADFKELIQSPGWLKRPGSVAQASHQITLFARALGAVFNAMIPMVQSIRRMWIVSLASGVSLDEHGEERAVFRRGAESDALYLPRVLAGLRAKTPGETVRGMTIALDTLGLKNYEIIPLWKLDLAMENFDPDTVSASRWSEFNVKFKDADNPTLTDTEIQRRIDAAKGPSKKGNVVRMFGEGHGLNYGNLYGGIYEDPENPGAGFGTLYGQNYGG